ncbi:addiction module protein [Clostridia bacterium]|nr:addiction module protein [Clostridia bacterium]
MTYRVVFTKNALKDIPELKSAKIDGKAKELIEIIKANPYQNPPPFENLLGQLSGNISRRINYKHRLVYKVYEEEGIIKVLSMWSHYEF